MGCDTYVICIHNFSMCVYLGASTYSMLDVLCSLAKTVKIEKIGHKWQTKFDYQGLIGMGYPFQYMYYTHIPTFL
jgi:hypothetical protein